MATSTDIQEILKCYHLSTKDPTTWDSSTTYYVPLEYSTVEDTEQSYELLRKLEQDVALNSDTNIQDEPDPLGGPNSIMRVLRYNGLIKDNNSNIKQKYFISSKNFDPQAFLRDIHGNSSFETLGNSLDILEGSIEQQSKALKYLVEKEFVKFVHSKSSLDNVYKGVETAGFVPDYDYGIKPLDEMVTDASSKSAIIYKPIVESRAKEQTLRTALSLVEANKYYFNLPSTLNNFVQNNDYEGLIDAYNRGRDIKQNDLITSTSPEYVLQIQKLIDRIWEEVEVIVDSYRKHLWRKLSKARADENYLQLISKLLELGVEDNPIIEWINSRAEQFEAELSTNFSKAINRIKASQATILATSSSLSYEANLPIYLRDPARTFENKDLACDTAEITEMWFLITKLVDIVIGDACFKISVFWNSCKDFLNGRHQQKLPHGYNEESLSHLNFADYEIRKIQETFEKLICLLASKITDFFDLTQNDLSLYSNSNESPTSSTKLSSSEKRKMEAYGFLPPTTNSISTLRNLITISQTLESHFTQLGQLQPTAKCVEALRWSAVRCIERFVAATCSTWAHDSSLFNHLEDFSRSETNRNCTKLPQLIVNYQTVMITGIHVIAYIYEQQQQDQDQGQTIDIFFHPSKQLLAGIQVQFLRSFDGILESLMKLVKNHQSDANDGIVSIDVANEAVLWTLSNVGEIRKRTYPHLTNVFTKSFQGVEIRNDSVKVTDILEQMDTSLFDAYTKRIKGRLSQIIRHGILKSGYDWGTIQSPSAISSFIYEVLGKITAVHSRVADISFNITTSIIIELQDHVAKIMLETLRQVDNFGVGGSQQVAVNTEFFRRVLSNSLSRNCGSVLDMIIKTVSGTNRALLKEIEPLVENARSESLASFLCFEVDM